MVAFEGILRFGTGGMTGSMGTVGSSGKLLTKEWATKFIIGQEFSFPLKFALDKLREGIWR